MVVEITITGDPVPKGRPRFRIIKGRKGSYVSAYTDSKTLTAEHKIQSEAKNIMQGKTPLEGALSIALEFFVPIPKSFSKIKREKANNMEILPVTRPDIDNYIKLVLDALNGIAFVDDNQITDVHSSKRYSDNTGIKITLRPMGVML